MSLHENKGLTCSFSRWSVIKNSLSNLSYDSFFTTFKDSKSNILLDVRTAEETTKDAILDAMHINYLSHTLADDLEQLDPDKSYYVFCMTGRRSARVCVILRN